MVRYKKMCSFRHYSKTPPYDTMKTKNKLTSVCSGLITALVLSSNIAFSQANNNTGATKSDTIMGIPYFIKLGEGTGGVMLGISNIDDVQKIFGPGKIKIETTRRLGKTYTEKTISYKKKGLKFFALNDSTSKIYCIEVSMPNARTEKDILIGVSTQDDVLKAYGEPSYRSPESLEYDSLGAVFEFNNGKVERVLLSKSRQ